MQEKDSQKSIEKLQRKWFLLIIQRKTVLFRKCFWYFSFACIIMVTPQGRPQIFIYNESLPLKFYQFFKICKRFDMEREKTLMHQSMRKEKLINFIRRCFIKPFNMIINHFLFRKLIRSAIFAFWYQKYQKRKLGTANSLEWQVTIKYFTDKMCIYDT